MADGAIDQEALHFFNELDGVLVIKLDQPTSNFAPYVINQVAQPTAKITALTMKVSVLTKPVEEWEEGDVEDDLRRPLTEAEWQMVVLRMPALRLRGLGSERVFERKAPDGATFTIRDLVAAITETERQSRPESDWQGGIDVHHVWFNGIHLEEEGVWAVDWDS